MSNFCLLCNVQGISHPSFLAYFAYYRSRTRTIATFRPVSEGEYDFAILCQVCAYVFQQARQPMKLTLGTCKKDFVPKAPTSSQAVVLSLSTPDSIWSSLEV